MASLIGSGPSFPYNVSSRGGLDVTDDLDRINQSLFILFETPIGDRLMVPEFGSNLHKYKFDPLDTVLMEKLRYTIRTDIAKWEPRIEYVGIEFLSSDQDIDNSILYISITYKVISSQVTTNYVYPYKLEPYEESYN